jgi:hypothetical protein
MNIYKDGTELKGGLAELFPHTYVNRTVAERLSMLLKGKGWPPKTELVFDNDCLDRGIDQSETKWWNNASR